MIVNVDVSRWLNPFKVYAFKVTNGHAVSKFIFKSIIMDVPALVLTIGEENNKVPKTRAVMFVHDVHVTSKPDKL